MNQEEFGLRSRNDFFFFQVSLRYLSNFLQAKKDFVNKSLKAKEVGLENLDNDIKPEELFSMLNDKPFKQYAESFFALRTISTILIINSAMCLEAFINDYCVIKKSNNFFKTYIEKLDVSSKWIVITSIVSEKPFPTDSKAFEMLKNLISARNNLVHPKSKEIGDYGSQMKPMVKDILGADKYFLTIYLVMKEFEKIDSDFEYLQDYKFLWDEEFKFKNISDFKSFYSYLFNNPNYKNL